MASGKQDGRSKLAKKLNKLSQKLLKKEGIQISNEISTVLCVCNGGLDNGVSREEIFDLFSCHSKELEVIMVPQKSYCFACFSSKTDAERAYRELNGHKLPPSEQRKAEVILYTVYVSEAPCTVAPTTDRPPGLILLEDFITEEYAERIMNSIKWDNSLEPAQVQALKHRRVKHYGYEFKYSINNIDPDEPLEDGIPDMYKPLLDRMIELGHIKHYPDQLTINQYQPGQGIPPHIDTPSAFEDGLVSLSLGSQVLMEFRHKDGRHLSVLLPERSALIMTGESRYHWSHGITPRKSDIVTTQDGSLTLAHRGVRTSFTFRKITGVKPPELSRAPSLPNTDETAAELEKLHVHKVYEEIADHFSGTRHTPWPRISEFVKQWPPGSLMADFGCGNGKYFGINKQIFEIGSDRSYNLAKICQERNFQVFVGDVLSIPLRNNVFDVCLCIAVIHHLSTEERRKKAIAELLKILRPGGQALIYVWALEQELNKVKSKYLKKKNTSENNTSEEKSDSTKENSVETTNFIDKDTDMAKSTESGSSDREENGCDINVDKEKSDTNNTELLNSNNSSNNVSKETSDENNTELPYSSSSSHPIQHTGKLEVHVNRTKFKQQDVLVPWQLKSKDNSAASGNTFHRYYHVFQKGEIETLCESVGNCKVVNSYYDQGNWAVILEKLGSELS